MRLKTGLCNYALYTSQTSTLMPRERGSARGHCVKSGFYRGHNYSSQYLNSIKRDVVPGL